MNPQPLSSLGREWFSIFTSVKRTVELRPEHATLAARVVGEAGTLDAYLSSMLIAFLGAEATPSFAMFDAIHQTAKNAALQAAARSVLASEDMQMLSAILTFVRAVDKHRNRIAHWLWAICWEIDDGFVLIDPAENFRFLLKVNKSLAAGQQTVVRVRAAADDFDYRNILNYRKADLQAVVDEYATINRWLMIFRAHINPHIEERPQWRYDQLDREPRLQAALARIRGEAPQPDP